jgi:SRSO17 transposase
MAERLGVDAQSLQQFVTDSPWSEEELWRAIRQEIIPHLEPLEAWVVDETGWVKQGSHSVGVAHQYCGAVGKKANCQVSVEVVVSDGWIAAPVGGRLYLPESWSEDRERCLAAGIPEEVEFATKPELARCMIERALQAGAPCSWVAADEVYGNNSKLRQWLEEQRLGYVLAIASDLRMRWPDHQLRRVDAIAQSLPSLAWERLSAGLGSKGERLYDWTLIRGWEEDGWSHGLLLRRSIEEQPEHAYYWFYAPTQKATLQALVLVAGQRWQIEQAFQAAKGQCGLDHYEVRHWQGWYRHITLAMLAHAVLVVLRARGEKNSRRASTTQRSRTASPAGASTLARMARH